jgi:hypothetical protein
VGEEKKRRTGLFCSREEGIKAEGGRPGTEGLGFRNWYVRTVDKIPTKISRTMILILDFFKCPSLVRSILPVKHPHFFLKISFEL